MALVIPDDWITKTHLTEDEVLKELVIALFQQERLTLGQASTWLGIDRLTFQRFLAERHIPVHYGIAEYDADMATIRQQEWAS